jgi:predicted Zn-dependent peptidase
MSDVPGSVLPRPEVAAAAPWSFPASRRRALDNGLSVLVYDLPGRPLASVRLVVDAPLELEPRDGTAALTTALWSEGTTEDDAETFARKLDLIGASYGAAAGHNGLAAELTVPAAELAAALDLAAASVIRPAFADQEVARLAHELADAITERRSRAEGRARLELYSLAFTPDSRLSRPVEGTAGDIAALDPDTLRAFHAANVSPGRSTLILAGDFTGTDVTAAVTSAFGSWSGERGTWAARPPHPAPPRALIVDRPGAVQSVLRLGAPFPGRHSPDWAALRIAAYALGGGMDSRLSALLREEKGYTYSIRAALEPQHLGGLFNVACSVATDVSGPALADIVRVVATTLEGGIDSRERDQAADYFLRIGPVGYQTSAAVADQAAAVVADHLPDDFVDRHYAAMRAVTAESASRALSRNLANDQLSLVVVGDASAIESDIRAAWPGEVQVSPADQ